MAYTPTVYVDGSAPALSAVNLNKSETAIAGNDTRITALEVQRLTAAGDGTTDDTASINAQLAAAPVGSVMRGAPGKTYLISAPLVFRTGGQQTLDMTGCTVTLKANSNCNLLQNAAYTQVRSTVDAATTAGSTTVTSNAAGFTAADVGRIVSIAGAGPTGAGPGREVLYGKITTVTNGTTVTIATSTSGVTGAHATVTGAALKIFNRDARITIRGGVWNRGANASTTGNDLHNLLFRRVDELLVEDVKVTSSGGKYALSLGDVTDFTVRRSQFASNSDGVHVLGPATSGSISTVRGTCGDDAVSLTACDFTAYTDTVGDVVGVEITDVVASTPSTALLKFTSAVGVLLDKVHVRGATQLSTAQPAFGFAADTGTLNVGEITLTDIVGRGYVQAGTVDSLSIRNWRWDATANSNLGLYLLGATINRLSVNGARATSAFTGTHWLQLQGSGVVDLLSLSDIEFTGASSSYLVQHLDGTSTVNHAQLANVRVDHPDTSGGLYQASISGAVLGVVELTNVVLAGGAWVADLLTTTTIHAANVQGSGSAKALNVRAGAAVTLYGSPIRALAGTTAGTLTDITGPDVQVFTTSGSWTKPASATRVTVHMIGAGGGGGSGARRASGTATAGGAGGGGGGWVSNQFRAADLGATETVTVGTAGTAGAVVTVDDTNGTAGGNGGNSLFGTSAKCVARGGNGGGGGGTSAPGVTTGGAAAVTGAGSGTQTVGATGSAGNTGPISGASGGGGGGISVTPAAFSGGVGGNSQQLGIVGAGSSGNAGGAGGAGTGVTISVASGGAGGGGGASSTTAAGGAGGAGGNYGAGGGGGGSSLNTFGSGAGGAGASGIVVVVSD